MTGLVAPPLVRCAGCGQSFSRPRYKPAQVYCSNRCKTTRGPWGYLRGDHRTPVR